MNAFVYAFVSDPLFWLVALFTVITGGAVLASFAFKMSAASRSCILLSALVCTFVFPLTHTYCLLTGTSLALPVLSPSPSDSVNRSLSRIARPTEGLGGSMAPQDRVQDFGPRFAFGTEPENTEFRASQINSLFDWPGSAESDALSESIEPNSPGSPSARPPSVVSNFPMPLSTESHRSSTEFESTRRGDSNIANPTSPSVSTRSCLLAIWLAGTVLFLFGIARSLVHIRRLVAKAVPIDREAYRSSLEQAASHIGLETFPTIGISNQIQSPVAIGLLRSTSQVLIPKRLLLSMTPEQLVHVLTHEGAHIVNRDPLVHFIQNICRSLWWWHPLAYSLNDHLGRAREELCDNAVLKREEPGVYGHTLLAIGRMMTHHRPVAATVGLFGSGWKLEHRIEGLLNPRREPMTQINRYLFLIILSLFVGFSAITGSMTLVAQETPPEATDVSKRDTKPEASERQRVVDLALQDAVDLALRNNTTIRQDPEPNRRQDERAERIRRMAGEMAVREDIGHAFSSSTSNPRPQVSSKMSDPRAMASVSDQNQGRFADERMDTATETTDLKGTSTASGDSTSNTNRQSGQRLKDERLKDERLNRLKAAERNLRAAGLNDLADDVARRIANQVDLDTIDELAREREARASNARQMEQQLFRKLQAKQTRLAQQHQESRQHRLNPDGNTQSGTDDEFKREMITAVRDLHAIVDSLRKEVQELKKQNQNPNQRKNKFGPGGGGRSFGGDQPDF